MKQRGDTIPDLIAIFVNPKNEGNIGAVARAMKNFALDRLRLVDPCPINDGAYRRAMHAAGILDNAEVFPDLRSALKGIDYAAGTSAIDTDNDKNFLRLSTTPTEFAEKVWQIDGTVALVFGREDFGLLNEELELCDSLITIPADPEYPVLNISQAAAVVFYEIYRTRHTPHRVRQASGFEKERLYEHFDKILPLINYPEHKRKRMSVMFRRLMGRAIPSRWEFHTLMGVFSRVINSVEEREKEQP